MSNFLNTYLTFVKVAPETEFDLKLFFYQKIKKEQKKCLPCTDKKNLLPSFGK